MALSSLLRMVVQNDGDKLVIVAGQAPSISREGKPLRLFFPTVSEALHSQLVGVLVDEERAARLSAGETVSFVHDDGQNGPFHVSLRGHPLPHATMLRETGDIESGGAEDTQSEESQTERTLHAVESPVSRQGPPEALIELIGKLVKRGGSDLHLTDGQVPVWRVDGALSRVPRAMTVSADTVLLPLLSADEREQVRSGVAVDLAMTMTTGERLRVHVFSAEQGICGAIRLLRRRPPLLESLGMPTSLDDLATLPHGLVLVGGPTGSGKTTTLASLVQAALERSGGLLVTLEDPIEYFFDASDTGLVRQRQVGDHVVDFPSGLRDAMREDLDILFIGELRDQETIQLALTAAETGHLVFASIHARSAATTIARIVDGCPAEQQSQVRAQLADSLRAVVVQRLLPSAQHGGRVLAAEVMRVNRAISASIRDGRDSQIMNAIQAGKGDGMVPFERCLRDLVRRGQITREVASRAASDSESLELYFRS